MNIITHNIEEAIQYFAKKKRFIRREAMEKCQFYKTEINIRLKREMLLGRERK